MELGPDARTRSPRQQAHRFPAIAEYQHEQPCPTMLAGLRIAHHRTTAVVDLRFLSGSGEDDARRCRPIRSPKLANETLHRLIAACKTVIGNQVLPDGHGISATIQSLLDQLAIRFTGTRRPSPRWPRVGGHPYGRFCWRSASPPG